VHGRRGCLPNGPTTWGAALDGSYGGSGECQQNATPQVAVIELQAYEQVWQVVHLTATPGNASCNQPNSGMPSSAPRLAQASSLQWHCRERLRQLRPRLVCTTLTMTMKPCLHSAEAARQRACFQINHNTHHCDILSHLVPATSAAIDTHAWCQQRLCWPEAPGMSVDSSTCCRHQM
jgi:hypothetical protein